jgi:hypothetical protein
MKNILFLIAAGLTTQAMAQEAIRPFVLTDGHNIRESATTLSALNAGVRINRHLGAADIGAHHFLQDKKEVNASALDTSKPHCVLAVSNSLKPNDIMLFNGTFSHIGITYHVNLDLLSANNASSYHATADHKLEFFITPSFFGRDFFRGMFENGQRVGSALMIPAESVVDAEDSFSSWDTAPNIHMVCKKLSPCPTFGELKAIIGDALTFLPSGENVAQMRDDEIEELNGAQASCLQENKEEEKTRNARMSSYVLSSSDRIMALMAEVQTGKMTIQQATTAFLTDLMQAMTGEAVDIDGEN